MDFGTYSTFRNQLEIDCGNTFQEHPEFCAGLLQCADSYALTNEPPKEPDIDRVEQRDAHSYRKSTYGTTMFLGICLILVVVMWVLIIPFTRGSWSFAFKLFFGSPDGITEVTLWEPLFIIAIFVSFIALGVATFMEAFRMYQFEIIYYDRIEGDKPCGDFCQEECIEGKDHRVGMYIGIIVVVTFLAFIMAITVYADQDETDSTYYIFTAKAIGSVWFLAIIFGISYASVFKWSDQTNRYVCENKKLSP